MKPPFRVGTAAWSVPRSCADRFPVQGSHLERYCAVLNAVEVNSTFYRAHRPSTFARWAATVPPDFRFALKIPKTITHEQRLRDAAPLLDAFLESANQLGDRMGPLLVQLPPSLEFEPEVAASFFAQLRERHGGAIAFEPRHATWFTPEAEAVLLRQQIARVAADPPRHETDGRPAGHRGLAYFRLHGSPRIYYSNYEEGALQSWAREILEAAKESSEIWCIFDNTALFAAAGNALRMAELLGLTAIPDSRPGSRPPPA